MTSEYQKAKIIVELAAIVAYHGEAFLRTNQPISPSGIESYWLASRNRLDAWAIELKQLEERAAVDCTPSLIEVESQWETLQPLSEEILSSEVLTRIWTAIGCESDRRHESGAIEPFVRSILVNHLDLRQRLLRLVFNKMALSSGSLRTIDRMRRSSERWTDVLLGYVAQCCQVDEFAFDAARVRDFSSSLKSQDTSQEAVKSLLMVSLRSTFKSSSTTKCPNEALNSKICEAILSSYGNDLFDSTGQFQSLWQVRMTHVTEDTLGMIKCLASEHGLSSHSRMPNDLPKHR